MIWKRDKRTNKKSSNKGLLLLDSKLLVPKMTVLEQVPIILGTCLEISLKEAARLLIMQVHQQNQRMPKEDALIRLFLVVKILVEIMKLSLYLKLLCKLLHKSMQIRNVSLE
jgi:hypothetical protein